MTELTDMVPLASVSPFNAGISSAREETMISCLGRPHMPLTTAIQNDHVSDAVKVLLVSGKVGNVALYGIRPAVQSMIEALTAAFADHPELEPALRSDGMLCVRLRRPTSGKPTTKISNHAWGTAVDFMLDGHNAPGATGDNIPRFVALLIPYLNKAGWYSGVAFHDDMHFEAADETVRRWAGEGALKPAPAAAEPAAEDVLGRAAMAEFELAPSSGHPRELAEAAIYQALVTAAAAKHGIEDLLIYGLGSRESDWGLSLHPPGAAGTGDKAPRRAPPWPYPLPPDGLGWGRGLMQIDYQNDFGKTGPWRDAAQNIEFGTALLAANIAHFTTHPLNGFDPVAAGVAAYNCGIGAVTRAWHNGEPIDRYTTGKNYSSDVLGRRAWFASLGAKATHG